jgi:DNA-binding transcriptional LysR family regulator
MELHQLEYLIAVAEEGNFTRAAQRVHISQSGVSAQIRQLERELGTTLIDRSARVARLTDAGTAALPHARAALAAVAGLRQSVEQVTGLLSGRLTVGMVTACTYTSLFDALAAFHTEYPGVSITLAEGASADLTDQVRDGTADLALIGAADTPPGLETQPVARERLAVAAPPDHPFFAERAPVTLTRLAEFPVVSMPPGSGIRSALDLACAARGVRLDIALEASAPATVADLAARGLGVAVLSTSMAAARPGQLRAELLADAPEPALLTLIWKPAPGPALTELLRHCRAAFPEPLAAVRG